MGDCTTKPGVGKVKNRNNSMQQVFDKVEITQIFNNFRDIYEVRSFIIFFRRSSHSFLYRTIRIKPVSSKAASLRTLLILSSHHFTGVSVYLFPSDFPIKGLHESLISPKDAKYYPHLIAPRKD